MNLNIWENFQICISVPLIEKDKIIKTDSKTANVLNTFLSTIVSHLNIPEYPVSDPISNENNDLS